MRLKHRRPTRDSLLRGEIRRIGGRPAEALRLADTQRMIGLHIDALRMRQCIRQVGDGGQVIVRIVEAWHERAAQTIGRMMRVDIV